MEEYKVTGQLNDWHQRPNEERCLEAQHDDRIIESWERNS